MIHMPRLAILAATCLVVAVPVRAEGIIGAGSGSNGGSMTGKTNESSQGLRTGADNSGEVVPSMQGRAGVGTGDNAVLNAPREAVPGTKAPSQPSNLNGQSPQP